MASLPRLAKLTLVSGLVLAFPALALAHPGHDGGLTWDFSGGFAHPFSGWDHVLAMVAVGLWAAQLGGRARFLVPASFLALMALGFALGRHGVFLPGAEQAIAASVVALGLLVARPARVPAAAAMALAGLFALFHGFAHGVEMPLSSGVLGYGAGFILATAALQAAGAGLGALAARTSPRAARLAGWAIAAGGALLLAL